MNRSCYATRYAARKIAQWRCQKVLAEQRHAFLESMPYPKLVKLDRRADAIIRIVLPKTGERIQLTIHKTPWPGKLAWEGHVESGRKIGQRIGVLLAEAT
jgi:hypothetical protein